MITKSISVSNKRSSIPISFLGSLLRNVSWVIEALISAIIALFTSLFFILVNQKQREYDEWKEQPKESR